MLLGLMRKNCIRVLVYFAMLCAVEKGRSIDIQLRGNEDERMKGRFFELPSSLYLFFCLLFCKTDDNILRRKREKFGGFLKYSSWLPAPKVEELKCLLWLP